MSAHPETPPFRGIMGRWVGMGKQEENSPTETILILILICSEMTAVGRICLSKLEKSHGPDTKPVLWLLAQSGCLMQYSLLNRPLLMRLTVKNLTALLI